MNGQLFQPGVSFMDAAYARFLEPSDYDQPVDASPVTDDSYSSPPQTYPGCFGLPYQDHNYGAPPPMTHSPPPAPPPKENIDIKEEIVVTSDGLNPAPPTSMPPQPSIEEEIDDPTRCICDFIHDDGYMIQCDKCSVWQHIVCMGLDRDSIPDTYYCEQCHPRPVDRVRAREFQIRKREFLKTLVITSHDSSATDTDPEEVNNRLRAYGLDSSNAIQEKPKQKMKMKKRKERTNSRNNKKLKLKEAKIEKENNNKELNKKHKLVIKDFATKTAQAKKEKLTKKIEKMRAERISKEMRDDKLGCEDIKDDERIINTMKTVTSPVMQDENAQNPWDIQAFNEWEQSYEVAKYNQYTTYVQEYLNSTYINGHHNEIADLVTDGLRVQRCHIKELKNNRKGLESSSNIPNGQPVIEVIGKVMTRQQYDKDNFGQRQLSPFVFFYGTVFDLDLVIDASDYGNDARFIRRSCQPNAEVRHVVAGGQAHFITLATKDIPEYSEITIPYDYDYKKWNLCFECACLRNSCPVSRYQKRRLRFQKLQIGEANKKSKNEKNLKLNVKSPVKSPNRSPVKSQTKSPEKVEEPSRLPDCVTSPGAETIHVVPQAVSPVKMVRRSQISKQATVSTQISTAKTKSIRVPSQEEDSSMDCEPLTTPEPTTLRCAEVDSMTSPETKESCSKRPQETTEPEKRKLTREERKMEAIMKAFEKMEKRNARKASVDQHHKVKDVKEKEKPKEKEKVKEKEEVKKEKEKEKEIEKEIEMEEPEPEVEPEPIKEEVKEEEEERERVVVPEVIVQDKQEVEPAVEETMEKKEHVELPVVKEEEKLVIPVQLPPQVMQVKEKTSKGKKSRKASARRRTRNSSGPSGQELTAAVSVDESSTSTPAPPPPSISCPATPCEGPPTPPSFRFVKTKRHLMNEWYSEKVTDSKQIGKSEPLEVAVPDDSMFVTCLPSPRNSMDRLRRNSQSSGSRERFTPANDNSVGSAKKRWLRQAMGEGTSESGLASPVPPTGGMSPNPQMAMPSPGGSPPVDFVTPLKKRRLARESLSRESFNSESPTPTPTPTPSSEPPTPISFSRLTETFENKVEEIRLKNGMSSYFSALKSPEQEEVETKKSSCEDDKTDLVSQSTSKEVVETPTVSSDSRISETLQETALSEAEKIVESSVDTNSSSARKMDSEPCDSEGQDQISNSEHVSGSIDDKDQTVHSEQSTQVCDDDASKSAINSEPDSSEAVCVKVDVLMECDSVCIDSVTPSNTATPSTPTTVTAVTTDSEVDSTQSTGAAGAGSKLSLVTNSSNTSSSTVLNSSTLPSVEPCDSCTSAVKLNTVNNEQRLQSTVSSDKACSSTSSLVQDMIAHREATNKTLLLSPEKMASLVDSSTDKTGERRRSFTNLHSPLIQDSSFSVLDSTHTLSLDNKNEVSNSIDDAASIIQRPPHNFVRSFSLNDSFSSNNLNAEPSSYPNRHLKFLNDSNYSAETTVDSTTHFLSAGPSTGGYLPTNQCMTNIVAYDSDSMDVSSASEAGLNGIMEDKRSEDSMSSLFESTSSCESSLPPKEKKKVSLQEYLKRKKDKPGTPVPMPVPVVSKPSSVSSTVTTPIKLTNPAAVLEKIQPLPSLPSLPSLPMFEKTERKEFKSSSDLLSPIFNRKEKQEEVRKPMSLSERLRQEFGVDGDIDTENSTDVNNDTMETDEPPPPPPPPPQTTNTRPMTAKVGAPVPNGNAIPSLLSLKLPLSQSAGKVQQTVSAVPVVSSIGVNSSVPQMVPPPSSTPMKSQPQSTKLPLNSPLPVPLGNLLASIKSPAQLKNDLNASLAALKAQISKVQQQSLPKSSPPSTPMSGPHTINDQASSTTATHVTVTKPQVFDYGHQSSVNFSRQNSFPSSTSNHYQTFNKVAPPQLGGLNNKSSPGYNRVSPRYSKVSPTTGSQSFNMNNSQTFNNHYSSRSSPPLRGQKHASSSQKHSASVSSTSRKHKYS